jgi:hypothetical protein
LRPRKSETKFDAVVIEVPADDIWLLIPSYLASRRSASNLNATSIAAQFLFPHIRIELLLRTMLTRQWDDDAWPLVRHEIQKALALRSRLRKAGWWNSARKPGADAAGSNRLAGDPRRYKRPISNKIMRITTSNPRPPLG